MNTSHPFGGLLAEMWTFISTFQKGFSDEEICVVAAVVVRSDETPVWTKKKPPSRFWKDIYECWTLKDSTEELQAFPVITHFDQPRRYLFQVSNIPEEFYYTKMILIMTHYC